MLTEGQDELFRASALLYLSGVATRSGGFVSFKDLDSFEFAGSRVPLIQRPRGIRAVPGLDAAITILTTYRPDPNDRPYDDAEGPDGYLRYKWMGSDQDVRDNRSMREAMRAQKPLAWLFGVGPGTYQVVAPVYVVAEEPAKTEFVVAVSEDLREQWTNVTHVADQALRREYAIGMARRRVHQPVFRGRVLTAYESQCALCRLRHPELLDAAHIKEDADGGEPVVTNGMAMCAIHHRAFDQLVIGVRPDHVVEVRSDVLAEVDGPTLTYALQGTHGTHITLPSRKAAWPNSELLEERYERFRAAS